MYIWPHLHVTQITLHSNFVICTTLARDHKAGSGVVADLARVAWQAILAAHELAIAAEKASTLATNKAQATADGSIYAVLHLRAKHTHATMISPYIAKQMALDAYATALQL